MILMFNGRVTHYRLEEAKEIFNSRLDVATPIESNTLRFVIFQKE
jgi:hypothetical protein